LGARAAERELSRRSRIKRNAIYVLVVEPDLTLRLPREDEEQEFLRAYHVTSPETPSFLHFYEEGMPLRRYLEVLLAQERDVVQSPDVVPETFLFAFVGPRIVGRVAIRHALNDFLKQFGGHIGYVVVPELRRRGYATSILRLSIQFARHRLGIRRILVTCRDNNVASIRTIEKNGGVLDDIVTPPDGIRMRRYWIDAG
jgi:predicted acetyltransferase